VAFVTSDQPTPTGTAEADLLQLELSDPSLGVHAPRAASGPERSDGFGPPTHLEEPVQTPVISVTDQVDDPLAWVAADRPGSPGERLLQQAYGTSERAERFYDDQVLDHLNPKMIEFAARMDMAFIATSDASGECDCSLRAGPPGFITVLDERTVAYPEYRGNGVMASVGNISENAHIGVLLVDFVRDLIGLHLNGNASVVDDTVLRGEYPDLPVDTERGRAPERWVLVRVAEAYIHCRKHIPRLAPVERTRGWGSDDALPKGGDYFEAKSVRRVAATLPGV
jgi:uncharacterized protein